MARGSFQLPALAPPTHSTGRTLASGERDAQSDERVRAQDAASGDLRAAGCDSGRSGASGGFRRARASKIRRGADKPALPDAAESPPTVVPEAHRKARNGSRNVRERRMSGDQSAGREPEQVPFRKPCDVAILRQLQAWQRGAPATTRGGIALRQRSTLFRSISCPSICLATLVELGNRTNGRGAVYRNSLRIVGHHQSHDRENECASDQQE